MGSGARAAAWQTSSSWRCRRARARARPARATSTTLTTPRRCAARPPARTESHRSVVVFFFLSFFFFPGVGACARVDGVMAGRVWREAHHLLGQRVPEPQQLHGPGHGRLSHGQRLMAAAGRSRRSPRRAGVLRALACVPCAWLLALGTGMKKKTKDEEEEEEKKRKRRKSETLVGGEYNNGPVLEWALCHVLSFLGAVCLPRLWQRLLFIFLVCPIFFLDFSFLVPCPRRSPVRSPTSFSSCSHPPCLIPRPAHPLSPLPALAPPPPFFKFY